MATTHDSIRIAQLSDTHFIEPGVEAEGGFAYDTSKAFDDVYDHIEDRATSGDAFDLIVVTGDVADHGRAAQYQLAGDAFARFSAPVNVCPGNHDQDVAFTSGIGRVNVNTSRSIEIGSWCFLFVDSNAGVMVENDSGRTVDPEDYGDRLHRGGSLGHRESSWIRDMCAATTAPNVFVWIHHPPDAPVLTPEVEFGAEWRALMADLPHIRGMGAGHTHVPAEYEFEGRTVFVCPALKNNFDIDAHTLLPPGYRSYTFHDDGSIESEVALIDSDQWPRHPIGRSVVALLTGELSYAEFDKIVARKQAERAAE